MAASEQPGRPRKSVRKQPEEPPRDAPVKDADEPAEVKRVQVPVHRGDGVFSDDEHAFVDAEVAEQWDSRLWHDRPPR